MRENLFRGKKHNTSVFDETDWVYGSLIDSGNHEQVAIYPWFNGASTMSVRQLVYARMEAVKPETVGQCTGVLDKTDRRIFEADIVKYIAGSGKSVIGFVVYEERCGQFYVHDGKHGYFPMRHGMYEIIGNIHDNPELMKGETP